VETENMPINVNLPIPVVNQPNVTAYDDPVDVPMWTNDYRFSGQKLQTDHDGNIIKTPIPVCQPTWWSNRAVIQVPMNVLV